MPAAAFLHAPESSPLRRRAFPALACLLAIAGTAQGQSWTWTGETLGQWGTDTNWDLASVPNAADAVVNINIAANPALTVNVSDTGTGGTYPYTFGTLATNIASGGVVVGSTATTTDILTAAVTTGLPVLNVATLNTNMFFYANLEGTQGFEKTGAGKFTWRFNGADQTYTGDIRISGGVLGINQNGSLGNDENDITIATGARLLAEPGSNSGTIRLPATRTITLAGAESQLGAGNAAVNLVIEGNIGEDSAGRGLVKTDAGVVTLQGTLSYTGETRIAGGTLALSGPALLPADQNLRFNGPTGTLNVGATSQTVRTIVMDNTAGTKTITGAGGSLLVNGDANLQLNGANGVVYSFNGLDSFTFDRANRNFNVQAVNVDAVTTIVDLNLATGGAAGGTNAITAGQILIGGGNSLGNNGNTARLRLGTTNTLNAGTFQLGGFNAGGVVQFFSGLTNPSLKLRGTDGTSPLSAWVIGETSSGSRRGEGVVDLTGGSLDAVVTDIRMGRHIASANNNDTSSMTMPAGTLTAATLAMAVKANGGTPRLTSTFNQSGGDVSIGAITLGDGGGTAAAILLPTYNLTGGSLAATTIAAGAGTSYDLATTARTLNIDGGTVRNLAGGSLTINGLDTTSSGRINLTLGAAGGTFAAEAGQAITIGANTAVTGGGGIQKAGAGSLVVAVDAAYTGATSVAAGTLLVTGALSGTSGVAVLAGGTLAGSGSLSSADIASGATLSPGDGIGTLTTTGGMTWAGGGNLNWQLVDASAAAGTGWDLVAVGGPLSIAATSADPFRLNLWTLSSADPATDGPAAGFDPAVPFTWTIASAAGGISGFAADGFDVVTTAANGTAGFANSLSGGSFSVALSGNDLQLRFTPGGSPTDIVIDVPSGTQTQAAAGYPTIASATAVRKIGAGTVVFDAANAYTGPTTIEAGTLEAANADALGSSPVTVQAGATLAVAAGTTMKSPSVTLAGGVLSAGSLAVNETTGIGSLTVSAGSLAGAPAVTVDGGGDVTLPTAARVAVSVGSLAVAETAGGGRIDMGSGRIAVGPGGITAAALRADLIAGRNGGAWNGQTGIMTSAAASGSRAVGYIANPDGSAVISFAAPGDVDLSGQVNVFDLVAIDSAGRYGTGQPAVWNQGDFNYDGISNIFDLIGIDSAGAYGQGNYFPPAPSPSIAVAPVPEPTGWWLVALAAAGGIARLRRRRR